MKLTTFYSCSVFATLLLSLCACATVAPPLERGISAMPTTANPAAFFTVDVTHQGMVALTCRAISLRELKTGTEYQYSPEYGLFYKQISVKEVPFNHTTTLVAITLPPGEYQIIKLFMDGGQNQLHFEEIAQQDYRLLVGPTPATYYGRITVDVQTTVAGNLVGVFGWTPANLVTRTRDNFAEDKTWIAQEYPAVTEAILTRSTFAGARPKNQ